MTLAVLRGALNDVTVIVDVLMDGLADADGRKILLWHFILKQVLLSMGSEAARPNGRTDGLDR